MTDNNNNNINLLYEKDIIDINLIDNKLYVKLLGNCITDDIFLKHIEVLELFYNICKKKQKKFYFIVDLSLLKLTSYYSTMSYIPKCIYFLKKHNEFYKKYKHGTIFITETSIAQHFSKYLLSLYTPVRPYKFVLSNQVIDYNFD